MIFDANMRYLSKGTKFTARVFNIGREDRLAKLGVKWNDLIVCEMVDETHDEPRVKLIINKKEMVVKSDYLHLDRTWLILERVTN